MIPLDILGGLALVGLIYYLDSRKKDKMAQLEARMRYAERKSIEAEKE